MQPLGTYDLYLNLFVAVVMPILIVANLMGWSRNAMNDFLWREHAPFMWLSLIILGLLTVWSWTQLAVHFGLLASGVADVVMMVVGIPFLVAAVAEIWMGTRLFIRWMRTRGSTA
jgi:hypothetical protein